MKMRIFMRFLLTLYILVGLFISGVMLACAWGIIDIIQPQYWLAMLYDNIAVRLVMSVIGVAVIVLSIALMFSGIRKRKLASVLVKETGIGSIAVSLSAIEEMTTRHISSNQFVKSVKASINIKDSKINISAKMAVLEDSNIPEMMLSLQTSLKEYIELLVGIEVNNILLLVEKTSQVAKARVE